MSLQQSDPHEEPLRVDDRDGLHLPTDLCGRTVDFTVRTPSQTAVCYRKHPIGPTVQAVVPADFTTENGNMNPNHVDANEVYLEPHGEDGHTYTVEVDG